MFFAERGEVVGTGFVALSGWEDDEEGGGQNRRRRLASAPFGVRGIAVPEPPGNGPPPLRPEFRDAGTTAFLNAKGVLSISAVAGCWMVSLWIG